MGAILAILIAIASVLLVLIVLMQNPKGGGLSTDFGAAGQIGGVKKTTDFIEKATWSLAGFIAVTSIVMTLMYSNAAPDNLEENTEDNTEIPFENSDN